MGRRLSGHHKFAVILTLHPMGGLARNGEGKRCGSEGAEGATLSVEQCLAAMEECGAPVVAISGGEPLGHPEIASLTRAILERGKHLFLCTDGTLIRRRLHMIPPFTSFFWNVKLDGTEQVHDARAGRAGLFRDALDGVRAAKNAGFFTVVTSSVCPRTDIGDLEILYETLHALHVDGYVLTPHYPVEKLCRDGNSAFHERMHEKFREASERLAAYNLMISPIYLEYLRGERELDCSVWASPLYGPAGWSAPCCLQNAKFAESYKDLLAETVWENYGRGLNPRCENCQCHAGFETAAILGVSPKAGDLWKMLRWQLGGNLGEKREGKRQA